MHIKKEWNDERKCKEEKQWKEQKKWEDEREQKEGAFVQSQVYDVGHRPKYDIVKVKEQNSDEESQKLHVRKSVESSESESEQLMFTPQPINMGPVLKYLGLHPTKWSAQTLHEGTDLSRPPLWKCYRDAIIIAVDIKRYKDLKGKEKISEIGLSMIDTRDIGSQWVPGDATKTKNGVAPGDRGFRWHRYFKNHHAVDSSLLSRSNNSHQVYAYGQSHRSDLLWFKDIYDAWILSVQKHNLGEGEDRRTIILAAWDLARVKSCFVERGVDWFLWAEATWDIQQMEFAHVIANALGKPRLMLEDAVLCLGIDIDFSLLDNAGNSARVGLELLIAGLLLTFEQRLQLALAVPLPRLPSLRMDYYVKRNAQLCAAFERAQLQRRELEEDNVI